MERKADAKIDLTKRIQGVLEESIGSDDRRELEGGRKEESDEGPNDRWSIGSRSGMRSKACECEVWRVGW